MMYFRFLSDRTGKILFFSKYLKKKNNLDKWERGLRKTLYKEKIFDADLEDFLTKMRFKKSGEFSENSSKIKIYENEKYKFFEITNSKELDYSVSEEVLEKIKDKNDTEYILVKRGN